jgi:hypothetical protein
MFARPRHDVAKQIPNATFGSERFRRVAPHRVNDHADAFAKHLSVDECGRTKQGVTGDGLDQTPVTRDDFPISHARVIDTGLGVPVTVIPLAQAIGLDAGRDADLVQVDADFARAPQAEIQLSILVAQVGAREAADLAQHVSPAREVRADQTS